MFRTSNGLKRVALSAFKVQNKRLANANNVSLLRNSSKRFGSVRYYSAGSGFHAEPEPVAYKMQGIALAAALSGVALYMVLPRSNKKPVEIDNSNNNNNNASNESQSDGPGVKPETPSEQEQGQTEDSLKNDSNDESDEQPEEQGKEEKEEESDKESDKESDENIEHEQNQEEDKEADQNDSAAKEDAKDSSDEKPEKNEQSAQDEASQESKASKSDSEKVGKVEKNDSEQQTTSTKESEDLVEVVTPAGDEILIADGPKTGEQPPADKKSKDEPQAAPVVPSTQPANEAKSENEPEKREAAYNPETGEINWDCPCLGGMAQGPCGEEFKEAFSCFVYSEAEPKGIDCVEKFQNMQNCFRANPEYYADQIKDEEEAASAASAAAAAAVEEELSAADVPVAVPAPEEIVIEESNISNNPTLVVDEIDVESADTNPQGPEIIADPVPAVETPEILVEETGSKDS